MNKYEVINNLFKEVVQQSKQWGFKVYANENIFDSDYRYGWITNGIDILYFQINDNLLIGLQFIPECIPNKDSVNGFIDIPFTKEGILKGFKIKYGKPYENFEYFKKHQEMVYQKIKQL